MIDLAIQNQVLDMLNLCLLTQIPTSLVAHDLNKKKIIHFLRHGIRVRWIDSVQTCHKLILKMQSSEYIHRQTSITVQAYVLPSLSSSRYTRSVSVGMCDVLCIYV